MRQRKQEGHNHCISSHVFPFVANRNSMPNWLCAQYRLSKVVSVLVAALMIQATSGFTIPSENVPFSRLHSPSLLSSSSSSSVEDGDATQQPLMEKRESVHFDSRPPITKSSAAVSSSSLIDRRKSMSTGSAISALVATATSIMTGLTITPAPAQAEITKDSMWPLWPALPVAPYSRRRTIRYDIVPGSVWAFDQMIGIYYVHVPIRMTVVARKAGGLLVYAPVAPTKECLSLLQELIDEYGPVQDIILPSVAVEHKVNAGPFARAFPDANFYITDRQYAFPLNLPNAFLGLPPWTQPLPPTSTTNDNAIWGGPNSDIRHEVITVKPGIGSMYQDVALLHVPSRTLLVCDAVFAVDGTPPRILQEEPEYTRALLFHARESKDDVPEDTPANRKKGWRRIVLLFNFFFPGSGRGDLGLGPILEALGTPGYRDGWGGWKPFSWGDDEVRDFETFSRGGKPTILPIIQIILSRGPGEVRRWLDVVMGWDFVRVVPAHLDAPLAIGPKDFGEAFDGFVGAGKKVNGVRFCDEDVAFLRKAEEGPLSFSVYKTDLGVLRGEEGCNLVKPPKGKKA